MRGLPKELKQEIMTQYQVHENDTGTPEVQVALLTKRIKLLTEHLKKHRKDFTSRRGLLMMVGKRSDLLRYLKRKDRSRYLKLIQSLGLRK